MEENNVQAMTAEDYVAELDNIRNNTVSREEYARVCNENRTLANALTTGTAYEQEAAKPKANIEELRAELMSSRQKTNLEYFTQVLEFRDALIEQEGIDPFLPVNSSYVPNDADLAKSQEIADALKECVEYADGNPKIFTVELQRRCGSINNKLRR